MGKIIDISDKIKHEPTFLHLADNMNYKVDDSKNTVFEVMNLWDKDNLSEMDKIDMTIKKTLGKSAFDEINKLNLSIQAYKTVSMAIMATISGETLEAFEARFQQATEE